MIIKCYHCQNEQEYNPLKKWDGHKRRTTNCKNCGKGFTINKGSIIKSSEKKTKKIVEDSKTQKKSEGDKVQVSTGGLPTAPTTFQDLTWKQKLEHAIFGKATINTTALTLYEKLGYLKEDEQEEEGRKFIFREPDWFAPHQKDMYDAFIKGNACVIGMRQLTYKTTTALCAAANLLHTHDGTLIVEISTGNDLSKELIGKIDTDKRVRPVWEPILKTSNRESKILNNKSRLICRPCKPSSLQGLTGGVWIDELDEIIIQKETREALAAVLPIVLTLLLDNTGWVWITCNQASDEGVLQFEYFLRILAKFGNYFPVYRIQENPDTRIDELIQINEFDVDIPTDPQLKKQFVKNMLYELMTALHGVEFAKAQILNEYDDSSGMFRAELVADAFTYWNPDNFPKIPYNSVMSIDPGHTHATAVIILHQDISGALHQVFYKEYTGKGITEDAFKDEIFDLYRKYYCRVGYVESNSGGKWWRDHWVDRGLNFHLSNFGVGNPNTGDISNMTKAFERAWYERVLKDFLEKHKIFLEGEPLLRQFSLYNPTDNKESGKGDLVDALLHCVFWAAGGINYLMSLIEGKESIVDEEGGAILL